MKKILAILFIISALAFPLQALAISAIDQKAVDNGTEFYDPSFDAGCLGGPAGSGPLFGPAFPAVADTAQLSANIKKFIIDTTPSSPLKDYADYIVSSGQKNNVNPVLLLGVAVKETSLATTGSGPPPRYNFWGNNKGSTGYTGYNAAIDGYYENLRNNSAYKAVWAKGNAATVNDINYIASPPSENATAAYVKYVNDLLQKILGGTVTSITPGAAAGPTTNSCGQSVNSAGAFGWNLSGANSMVFYAQGDPRWANLPYGAGKSSIVNSGCGPTSLAMVAATLTGNTGITPVTIANQYGARYHGSSGTEWGIFPAFAADYHLKMTPLGTDLNAAAGIIRAGGLVVISVDPGFFTKNGHIMVIRAVTPDGNGFYLANPGRNNPNDATDTTPYTADFLRGQGSMKQLWGYQK